MTRLQLEHATHAYDYDHQAWIERGNDGAWRYLPCAHPATMDCRCYGKVNAGAVVPAEVLEVIQ